jgi:hypothetical protein
LPYGGESSLKKRNEIFVPLILLCLAVLACSFSLDMSVSSDSEIVNVAAKDGWNKTEIIISEGDLLTITYLSGEWSPWPGGKYDGIGSGGDPRCRCNVMDGVSHAALIGRIGNNDPFFVGNQYHHKVGETGELFLGINDVDLYDNSGYLRVRVEID